MRFFKTYSTTYSTSHCGGLGRRLRLGRLLLLLLPLIATTVAQGQNCDNPTTITIGTGTGTSQYLWGYSYYRYSLTEQIYRREEMGSAMTLTGMEVQIADAE